MSIYEKLMKLKKDFPPNLETMWQDYVKEEEYLSGVFEVESCSDRNLGRNLIRDPDDRSKYIYL